MTLRSATSGPRHEAPETIVGRTANYGQLSRALALHPRLGVSGAENENGKSSK